MESHNLKKVIVFIPCLNEEETVATAINRVRELYPSGVTEPKGYHVELLVVNDGSTDRTEEIAISKGVKVVSHQRNIGLGGAVRTALDTAYEMGADIAVKIDADLQHPPEDIEKVIMPILEDKSDICLGSRFAGKIHYKMPLIRRWGNRFFTWLMNKLTTYRISDAQTGLFACNRKYLSVFEMHGNYNAAQQLLIDAFNKHMRYSEVPVDFHPRKTGKSFVTLRYPFYVLVNIFRILTFANPLKVFSIIGVSLIAFSISYFGLSVIAEKFSWDISFIFVENLSLAALIVGVQAFFFGVLADLIIHKRK
ncbi:MAG: glycosyltransferase family 2 protein [Candidatus Subteraquimicrobiales bacterium]|nr:glycosyltransferase family 2 protein [Candidatus Subteraquimicrobiales bacterium]